MISIYISEWENLNTLVKYIPSSELLSIDIDANRFIDNDFYSMEGKRCKIKCLRRNDIIDLFSNTDDSNFFFKNFYPYEDNYEVKPPEKTQYIKKYIKVADGTETLFCGVIDYNSYNRDYVAETIEFELVDLPYILFENFEDNSDLRLFLSYTKNIFSGGIYPFSIAKHLIEFNSMYPVNLSERITLPVMPNNNIIYIPEFTQIFNRQPFTREYIYEQAPINESNTLSGFSNINTILLRSNSNVVYIEYMYKEKNVLIEDDWYIIVSYIGMCSSVKNINNEQLNLTIDTIKYPFYVKNKAVLNEDYISPEHLFLLMLNSGDGYNTEAQGSWSFEDVIINFSNYYKPVLDTNYYTTSFNDDIMIKVFTDKKLIEAMGSVEVIYTISYNSDGSVNLTSGNTSGIFNPDAFSQAECMKNALLSCARYLEFSPSQTYNKLNISSHDIIQKYLAEEITPVQIQPKNILSFSKKQEIFLIEKAINDLNFSETDRHFLLYIIKSNIVNVFSSVGKTLKLSCLLTSDISNIKIGDVISVPEIEENMRYLVNSVTKDLYNYTVEFELIQIKSNLSKKSLDINTNNLVILSQFVR